MSSKQKMEDLERRNSHLLQTLNALQARVDALKSKYQAKPVTSGTVSIPFDLAGKDNQLQQQLRAICVELNLRSSCFKRTPLDYYDWPLSKRKEFLQAPSEDFLCKCIVAVNTHCAHDRFDDANDSKYYVLVVQYTAKLDFERVARLIQFAQQLQGRQVSKAAFNYRLASQEDNDRLTGYSHNAVTPLGLREKLPIILSDRIAKLPFVWLGGGEVDVKWRVATADFIRAFKPVVADITLGADEEAAVGDA